MTNKKRPDIVKVFADKSSHGNFMPTKFGTNVPVDKGSYPDIANTDFEYGLESLQRDIQLKDLNSIFNYYGSLTAYLFQQGIAEFSPYQNYTAGAVVMYNNKLWIAARDVAATMVVPVITTNHKCSCCKTDCGCTKTTTTTATVTGVPQYPVESADWNALATENTISMQFADLALKDTLLEETIKNVNGVTGFDLVKDATTNKLFLVLTLTGGTTFKIDMGAVGSSTVNADGSYTLVGADGTPIVIPSHTKTTRLTNSSGESIYGFIHTQSQIQGTYGDSLKILGYSDMGKGLKFNATDKTWEVDLSSILKAGSGFQIASDGTLSIKPADLINTSTLSVGNDGKITINNAFITSNITTPIKTVSDSADATSVSLSNLTQTVSGINATLNGAIANGTTVFTDSVFSGAGTKASPLTLNTTSASAPATSEDGTLPTTVAGAKDFMLGKPHAWVLIGTNLVVPVYQIS